MRSTELHLSAHSTANVVQEGVTTSTLLLRFQLGGARALRQTTYPPQATPLKLGCEILNDASFEVGFPNCSTAEAVPSTLVPKNNLKLRSACPRAVCSQPHLARRPLQNTIGTDSRHTGPSHHASVQPRMGCAIFEPKRTKKINWAQPYLANNYRHHVEKASAVSLCLKLALHCCGDEIKVPSRSGSF